MAGMSRQDMENKLVAKAWSDPAFRSQLKSNPQAAAEKLFGQKFPGNLKIHIHEEDANTVHLVIPPEPPGQKAKNMSLQELEAVAGGAGTDCCTAESAECW